MDNLHKDLEDTGDDEKAVGEVLFHSESSFHIVPFVHSGEKFLTYFTSVTSEALNVDLDTFRQAIEFSVENHKVGERPYALKFGLKENFQTEDLFGFAPEQQINNVHFTLPKKLAITAAKLFDKTKATEFYFLAGSSCEEHTRKLNIWYKRVADKLAKEYGFVPIHENYDGGWYGYKRIT